ncbi:DUF2461 domain-containing protein [Subsaximicrobium wynnwilliamsii]|uniref:DUF2461 domain-containing protein n=1 Tax=Subsaximicrobium wynnwilliamsii TaxID=291179 RepID=A0A5C6ZHM8_9FLAO|nr:DUF2461 domain-containing protein [Subsaximicrobium wynnwilliamsii]TXD84118.1 DUF2461 domain-containing protein [Subsaximicrobium wynnwilliamsii]TXD88924.1 DUF2461 domain-containing protein [Subsaximicrobium wynnwilliamsii]TXE03830.1 DUF2461 domain-containing protein [Subsaximicrobium wynnwilliamsii]
MTPLAFTKDQLHFLEQLRKNNDRDWFDKNKTEFKSHEARAKKSFQTIFENLKVHDLVEDFKVFRIYRDVRFSKNKLPYKTHFSASFIRRKPELRGSYYLHIQPNDQSFIATGFWEPNKEDLLRLRKEFEQDDTELRAILNSKGLKNIWGELKGDELKTAPRNFDKEHPAIDLIRKKQFIFTKSFSDQEVLSDLFIENVNTAFKAIRPYFDYMSDVLNTNLNGESTI